MAETSITYLPYYTSRFDFPFSYSDGHLGATCNLVITNGTNGTPVPPDDILNLNFTMRGPGEIKAFPENMIARVEPPEGSQDFEPNYFPFIEFVDADFPWRYTLDTLNSEDTTDSEDTTGVDLAADQIKPWLQLIVISFDEINEMIQHGHKEVFKKLDNEKELFTTDIKYLPDLQNSWATAHVQLTNTEKTKLGDTDFDEDYVTRFIDSKPTQHNSRLMCMRKLKPETHYYAILCPTYKAGLEAFLGNETSVLDNELLWKKDDETQEPIEIPIYYKWEFMTSEKGDFESLARELTPSSVDDKPVGTRVIDIGEQSSENEAYLYFKREGAIAKPGFSNNRENYTTHIKNLPFPEGSIIPGLRAELNESLKSYLPDDDDDPFVTFPVYGRNFRNTKRLLYPKGSEGEEHWPRQTPWIHELNLDLRNRVAGGFGTTVVQKNDDNYAKLCWNQVGDIRKANEILRRTKSSVLNSKLLEDKHLNKLTDERFTLISYPFHAHFSYRNVGASKSLKLTLQESGITPGTTLPCFRHVGHKYIGVEQLDIFKNWRIAEENDKKQEKEEKIRKPFRPDTLKQDIKEFSEKYEMRDIEIPRSRKEIFPPKAQVIKVTPINIQRDFRPKFNHREVLSKKVIKIISFNNGQQLSENFDPIITCPFIREPMYKELSKMSNDYILPGIENLENNGVTLLEENTRFIESYMCSLNHEMGRELIWREFPTDQKGTIFTQFWDATKFQTGSSIPEKDIEPIHTWTKTLGLNRGSAEPNLVLVIKGDLVRRYPETIIYAHKITELLSRTTNQYKCWSDAYPSKGEGVSNPNDKSEYEIIQPVFKAQLGKDILLAGFPFSRDNIDGDSKDGEYYFMLQENRDLPRYGLDIATRETRHGNNNGDPGWAATDAGNEGYINNFDLDIFKVGNGENAEWHSASIAFTTYQKPVRVAFHASTLLNGQP